MGWGLGYGLKHNEGKYDFQQDLTLIDYFLTSNPYHVRENWRIMLAFQKKKFDWIQLNQNVKIAFFSGN